MANYDLVGFVGSRSGVPAGCAAQVRRIVRAVFADFRSVAVGCSGGADATVLSEALSLVPALLPSTSAPHLAVFSAFGPDGQGALPGGLSAVALVCGGARHLAISPGHGVFAPVSIAWWAGSSPSAPAPARLAARRSALVRAVASSGEGRGLIAFFAPPSRRPSSGTSLACIEATSLGVPVVAFPFGFAGADLPALGAGSWARVPARPGSPWHGSFRWVPAQLRLC